jgi:hypothetical protein
LSVKDLNVTLNEEVFGAFIQSFKDRKCRDDYLLDYPSRFQVSNLRDVYPLNDYSNSLIIHHDNKDESANFSLKKQLSEVINYEE